MKLSHPLSPGRDLATRAANAVLVFAVFVMGALLGGILNGGTAWAATPNPTPTFAATPTPPATIATATGVESHSPPSSTPSAPPLPECAYEWKVIHYHWEAGEWTMLLRCPKEGGKPAKPKTEF